MSYPKYQYEIGQKIMWNSTRAGWIEVEVIRRSRKFADNHWVVKDANGVQDRIHVARTMPIEEWKLFAATKGIIP